MDNRIGNRGLSPIVRVLFVFPLFAFLVLVVAPVHAGSYELVNGKGVEVCEAYMKFLATQREALTCEREIPPQFSPLKEPNWQKLDPKEHKLLVLRIENYLQIPRDKKATQPWVPRRKESELDKYEVPRYALLSVAELDIDNDGTTESVAKYRSFSCQHWDGPRAPVWRAPLVVLDASKQGIDIEQTYPLMQNPGKHYVANAKEIEETKNRRVPTRFEYSKYAAGSSTLAGYDAFIYSGETYFDQWDEDKHGTQYQTLTVYKTETQDTAEICRYQFRW